MRDTLSHHKLRYVRAVGIAVLLFVGLAAVPRAAEAQDPASFVQNLGTQGIQVLGPSVPQAQRVARFRQLFDNDFDGQGIARFVLGRYAQELTPQQQQEFNQLFREYIVQAYAARLAPYGGSPFRVTGSRPNDNETIVTSQVMRSGGNPVEIDWHLINAGGRPLISDVYVEGVSMRVTHRSEFASIIQRNGGRADALLAALRQQLQMAQRGGAAGTSAPPAR